MLLCGDGGGAMPSSSWKRWCEANKSCSVMLQEDVVDRRCEGVVHGKVKSLCAAWRHGVWCCEGIVRGKGCR
jgi:hypothetical protein